MNRHLNLFSIVVGAIMLAVLAGCQPQQPIFLHQRGNIASHYIASETRLEYPDTEVPHLDDVMNSLAPLTLDNQDPSEGEWLLTLDEVRQMAMENSKVLRQLNGVNYSANGMSGMPSLLLDYPSSVATVWDPAIIESNPNAGVQATLAAYDTIWSNELSWNKSNSPFNNTFYYPNKNKTETGTFQSTLSKTVATGGNVYASAGAGYDWGNSDQRYFPSAWTSYVQAGFSQPLLRGAGVEYNRIAGPNGSPGNSNGVLLARINEDIALVDLELAVRDFLQDIEETYWNLYYAYRSLSAAGSGLNAALQSWRSIEASYEAGHRQGTTQNLAQAARNYQQFRVSVQEAQNNLYKNERALRYMIGIAATDGRLIKPIDEPTIAKVKYNWEEITAEALARAPELRKQKWTVKKRELELIAQRNYLLPQVDFEGYYKFNGMGKDLIDPSNHRSNAIGSLVHDKYHDWSLGISSSIAIGFRQEMAAVRNAELMLARERAILQEQEFELSHNMADLYADLDRTYNLIEDYLTVLRAARTEFRAVSSSFIIGNSTLYEVLQAQQLLAEAETNYYRMVIDYNLAIVNLNYQKGSLLEYNGITLAEGPWANKAYFDAYRRARERDAAHYLDYGFSEPPAFSRGVYPQNQGTDPTIIPDANHSQENQSEEKNQENNFNLTTE
ncbi:MAG: TolC family protein [Planctomycetia bacterium]|nr:TolC family protein [Planctomycetia bacterium]